MSTGQLSSYVRQVAGVPRQRCVLPAQLTCLHTRRQISQSRTALCVAAGPTNINQERGTKNALRSEKYSLAEKVAGDRSGVPGDEQAGGPNSYLALAAVLGLLSLVAAAAPHTAADFLFGAKAEPHDFLHEPLLRLLASGGIGGAAAALSLNIAASNDDLKQSAFQRVNLGLIAWTALTTLLAASNAASAGDGSVLSINGALIFALAAGLTIVPAWGGYGKSSEYGLSLKRAGPLPAVKKFQDDVADVPKAGGITSAAFTALSVALVVAGSSYLVAPEDTLNLVFGNVKGPECVFLWRVIGSTLLTLLPALSFSCREGEQQGSLAEAPFKALNVGLAGAGAGHVAVLAPVLLGSGGGPLLLPLLGTWALVTINAGANLLRSRE